MENIFLKTKDGVKIAANYRNIDISKYQQPIGWLVLTHMMPATKESWNDLAEEFQNIGYESIAIDLRGHGQSDGGPKDYRKFSDEEHQKSILDLEAGVDYLIKNRQAAPDKIYFIGASIGANLSLQYISEHQEFKTAILLSQGLNYRGIKTEPLIKNLQSGQKVLFVSARDDGDNAEENQKLYGLTPASVIRKIKIYDSGGHGTDILQNQAELLNLIIEFIE
ncbi:MAG: alpha/beta fold hydrolase [bacterium]|nr:alpha/beta fold hydrolase [bacterium]